jgi:hypothetical protein
MKFSRSLLTAILATSSPIVRAFTSTSRSAITHTHPAFVSANTNTRSFRTTTSVNMANVMKLSDPAENLMNGVDVFIFDCDGVIWRVRKANLRTGFVCLFVPLHYTVIRYVASRTTFGEASSFKLSLISFFHLLFIPCCCYDMLG